MKKTAIILGATGLTGSILLEKLLNDDRYKTIKLFSRKEIDGLPSKAKQFVGDILELDSFKKDFTADEVYCCIGTTAKKTPDKQLYKKIDLGIPVTAAKLAKANGIPAFLVISALGANAKSSIFYSKTKGEMEQAVLSEKIEKTHILQPSIIGGDRQEKRIGEKIGLVLIKLLQPLFFGRLKKYRITEAEDIAQAMINLANSNSTKTIITSASINLLAKGKPTQKLNLMEKKFNKTSTIQNILRIVLGAFMLYAGIGHLTFLRTEFQAQVPTWITTDEAFMDFIVLASGVVEIIFGVLMIYGGRLKIKTGIVLAIFYILIFPGNINQYVNEIDSFGLNTDKQRLIRLAFQPVLIIWALWSTGALKYLISKKKNSNK